MVKSWYWPDLNEEGRYEVWSEHINAGGKEITYRQFCDLMDNFENRVI